MTARTPIASGEWKNAFVWPHSDFLRPLPVVDRPQPVLNTGFGKRLLAVGQTIDRFQIVKMFHRLLRTVGCEMAAIGFGESGLVPFGQLAENGRVQRRVGRLATGRRPVTLGFHRFDHLFRIHRLRRFFENLDRGVDAAQLLFFRCIVGFRRLAKLLSYPFVVGRSRDRSEASCKNLNLGH